MLDQLGWASLQNRRQMLRLNMMYKIHNGLVAMDPQDHMTPRRRKSRHVHALGYEVPLSSTNYHQYSFFPKTIRDWNRLHETTVQTPEFHRLCNSWSNFNRIAKHFSSMLSFLCDLGQIRFETERSHSSACIEHTLSM